MLKDTIESIVSSDDKPAGIALLESDQCAEALVLIYEHDSVINGYSCNNWLDFFVPLMSDELVLSETSNEGNVGVMVRMLGQENRSRFEPLLRSVAASETKTYFRNLAKGYVDYLDEHDADIAKHKNKG